MGAPGVASPGYQNERTITINHALVPNSDQANFPVLISGTYPYLASRPPTAAAFTNPNGFDILFTSDAAGSNPLPFERASYNATTGAVNFFVQVPTLSHTTDTAIYMFFGNASDTVDPSNKPGAWDSSFAMVSHMATGSGTVAADSTSHADNGTLTGSPIPSWTSGKPSGGLNFPGSNSYVNVSNPANLNLGTSEASPSPHG